MKTFEDNRRDRWTREPREMKRLPTLQPRDIEVFRLLNRYPALRSTWLYPFVGHGQDETWFKKRLGLLFHGAYTKDEKGKIMGIFGPFLDRELGQKDAHNARYAPIFYSNGEKAEKHLLSIGDAVHLREVHIRNGRAGKIRQFAHTVAMCEVWADVEYGAQLATSVRFISQDEMIANAPAETRASRNPLAIPVTISYRFGNREERRDTHYVPDGWGGLEYTLPNGAKVRRYFALEINHGDNVRANNLKDATHLRKFLSLRAIRKRRLSVAHFGVDTPITALFVQADASVTQNSMGLLRELSDGKGSAYFAFKTIPHFKNQDRAPLPDGALLREPWERVGFDPLYLISPEGR